MPNILRTGTNWLQSQLMTNVSENCCWFVGQAATSAVVTNVKLVKGFADRSTELLEGISLAAGEFDWIVTASDLPTAFKPIEIGQVILWGDQWYVTAGLGSGQDCWRNSDEFGVMLRVHTKEISKPAGLTVPTGYTGREA